MKKLAHRRCLPRLSRGRGTRALRRALLNLFGQPLQSVNMKAAPYRSRRARRAAERPSTFSYSVAVTRQLAAVGRVILTWRARPARPSTRGALLLRDYARARPARPAHEREAALSGSRARPARPAHEREASLPPMAVTPEQGRQDRPMRGGASSPSSAPEQGRQGRRCEEWASV